MHKAFGIKSANLKKDEIEQFISSSKTDLEPT